MRKFSIYIGGLLALLIVLIVLVVTLSSGTQVGASASLTPVVTGGELVMPVATPAIEKYQVGIPAIQPHLNTSNPSTPTFTTQDVEEWIKNHPESLGFRIQVIGSITVKKVEFITNNEATINRQHGVSSLSSDSLICYVTLGGNFNLQSPLSDKVRTFNTAIIVFDALTGNYLASGEG